MHRERKQHAARWIRRGIAVLCLAAGTVGLLLPVVPGIPLLIVGVLLLRNRTAAVQRGHGLSAVDRAQLRFWQCCRSVVQYLQPRAAQARRR